MNPLFLIDFYKVGHVSQYPSDTTQVWSNWTPRSTRVQGQNFIVHFGLQYFIKRYLKEEFQYNFFNRLWRDVEKEYIEVIRATLGVDKPKTDHLKALHDLSYLPLDIYSLPEGAHVPLGVPAMVITNTRPEAYWLPNYLETILSNTLWMPSTSATTALRFRRIFEKYAKQFGETDLSFVDWQGHDFSFRGLSGVESGILSGMGHLTSFSGTDTIPAIVAAKRYYGADLTVGGSVPATEHSVMCAGGKDGEFETFKRLITETYPTGIVSIVSDTWDLWKVLTDYIPRLKDTILARTGKIVIRPDSGDPVDIMCGVPTKCAHGRKLDDCIKCIHPPKRKGGPAPMDKGAIRLLAKAMGTDGTGHINNAGLIYGDGISPERATAILDRTVNDIGLSPFNVVFGIGSYTYQYVTRDTYNFAMKATAVRHGSTVVPIFKDPVTDNAHKKSHFGIPAVYLNELDNKTYFVHEDSKPEDLDRCEFQKVFSDGKLLVDQSFDDIRKRARA